MTFNSVAPTRLLNNVSGSWKSKMAADKLGELSEQLLDVFEAGQFCECDTKQKRLSH